MIYLPGTRKASTIQVETEWRPVPAGGTGKLSLNWPVPEDFKAQWLACVGISRDAVCLFTVQQARTYTKQQPPSLYWFTGDSPAGALHEQQMVENRIDAVAEQLLADGLAQTAGDS